MADIAPWIPTITAVVAAVVAGAFAWRANTASISAQRALELEKRLATSRLESYKPMMEVMYSYLDPGTLTPQQEKQRNDRLLTAMRNYSLWGMTYGSDETVRVFHKMMQAAMHEAPPKVLIRMFGSFLLAARRDLGNPETRTDIVDLLGIRIRDIYETGMAAELRLPEDEYFERAGWKPPWSDQRPT